MPQQRQQRYSSDDAILHWLARTESITTTKGDVTMNDPATPPSQKRRRRDAFDPDPTPRSQLPHSLSAPNASGSLSTASTDSSSSNHSGRGSPRKRELALRLASHYPVYRVPIAGNAPPQLPESLLELLRDLSEIGSGKRAVVPGVFRVRLLGTD